MTLITKTLTEQLLANGRAQRAAIDKGNGASTSNPSSNSSLPTPNAPGSSPSSIPMAASPLVSAISGWPSRNSAT
jgi:hypothetical protein